MATNDTDPQREQPFHDDASRTDPDGASDAASLLAGLAESSQPAPNVPETEGHVAAAYAGAPRRPPRPNDKTVENPAVFVNATVPLPQPPASSGHQKLGPPAPPVVSMKGDPTVLGGARLFEALQNQTNPGERARNQMRVYFAAIAGVIVAALIAVTILAIQRTPTKNVDSPPSSSAPIVPVTSVVSSSAVAAPATPSSSSSASSSSSSSSLAPPSPSTRAPTSAKPTHARPHASSPSTRPSGNFAEPDRNL